MTRSLLRLKSAWINPPVKLTASQLDRPDEQDAAQAISTANCTLSKVQPKNIITNIKELLIKISKFKQVYIKIIMCTNIYELYYI